MRVGVGLRGALLWLQGSDICIASESIQPARPASSCGRLCTAYGQLRLDSGIIFSLFLLVVLALCKTFNVPMCVCVIFLMWEKRINNRVSDLAAWLHLCAPQTARKIQNSPKPAFSHGVQLGCVKAHSTTNAMFDCQTILSLHTHTHTCLHTGNIESHLSKAGWYHPPMLLHLFTHNYQPAKNSLPPLSLRLSQLEWQTL